jgi:tRNA(Arg) A34 adenosine deaminase TadA
MTEAQDIPFLRQAISLAAQSRAAGEDPFGAGLVIDGRIVSESGDRCIELSDPTAHAELLVISSYGRAHNRFSLPNATLYCSAEPCPMCAGAIHWAWLGRVVYSVPHEMVQNQSKGRLKPGCREIINSGNRTTEIVGPLLVEEGWVPFEGYTFVSKRARHEARFGTSSAGGGS